MFTPGVIRQLAKDHYQTFMKLQAVEKRLKARFADMDEVVDALILSVTSGEPLLLVGPPGTGKSRLIRAFCGLTGLLDEDDPGAKENGDYFEYLLTPFTEPGELFGFYDISAAMEKKELVRMEKGMMQHAKVVYLDEVFNGSSAILNSLLAFMNERVFHDRNRRVGVALQCLFAATNHVPESPELRAIFDRFLLRCHLWNAIAKPKAIEQLLHKGWRETYSHHPKTEIFHDLFKRLEVFRLHIKKFTDSQLLIMAEKNTFFYKGLAQHVEAARSYELSEMSNRRLVKMIHVMLIHRVYQAACSGEFKHRKDIELGADQLALLPRYFLDREDEAVERQMVTAAHEVS